MIKNKLPKIGYCGKCDDFVPYYIKEEEREVTVKDLTFKVKETVAHCKYCDEPLFVNEIESKNDLIIYDKYRELSGLLTSSEIKFIRKKRHLSQKQLSNLLCIGEKDITRYENGSIQTKAIDNMIRLIGDDIFFERLMELRKTSKIKPLKMQIN